MRRVAMALAVFSLSAVVIAQEAKSADDCDVNIDLRHDMKVSPEQVLVYDDQRTLYTLNRDGRLWVENREVQLDADQQRQVSEYAQGISAVVPKIFAIVSTALDVAGAAMHLAFSELFGADSPMATNSEGLMLSAQRRFEQVAQRQSDTYTIQGGDIGGMHDVFDEEFEDEVEEFIMSSMGSVFALVGQAIFSGDGAFEERMERFGENMDDWGRRMESDMEEIGADLKVAGEELCQDMLQLSVLEGSLRADVPELASFELFTPEHIRAR